MKMGTLAAVCGLSLGMVSVSQAALVAAWSFDTGTAADLNSSVGGYSLTARDVGSNPGVTYSAGSVTVGGGTQLYTTQINGTALPNLRSNATIYLKMRLDGAPTAASAFAGFVPGTAVPAGYANGGVSLAGFMATGSSAAPYAFVNAGATNNQIAPGSGHPAIPTGGASYATVAVVFNDNTVMSGAASTTSSSATIYVNGVVNTRDAVGLTLNNFDYFALGRVIGNFTAGPVTFDEVRIYDEALSSAQIAAIPEPTTLAAAGLAAAALLRRRRAGRA